MSRVLVTGASGFIGKALVEALRAEGRDVRAAVRGGAGEAGVAVGDLSADTDWRQALEGVETVVHLAGPAHGRFKDTVFQRAIVEATGALAEQAERAGVDRFVFVSSIKAAAWRSNDAPLRETDIPQPADPYGIAKRQAEELVQKTRLNAVVLRPPLVHAPDAKANFEMLLALAASGAPVPVANIENKRSMISREALIGAVRAILAQNDGPSGIFHLAEQPALSSAEIVTSLRAGLGMSPRLIPHVITKQMLPLQLRESLAVDDALFRNTYGYSGADRDSRESLAATAAAWKAQR